MAIIQFSFKSNGAENWTLTRKFNGYRLLFLSEINRKSRFLYADSMFDPMERDAMVTGIKSLFWNSVSQVDKVVVRKTKGQYTFLCLLGHCPVVLYSVSKLDTVDASVVIVFTFRLSFFSPAFLSFRNLKHTNVASSWRNLEDRMT